MATIPDDIWEAIGLTCWRAYKVMRQVNRVLRARLAKHDPRALFSIDFTYNVERHHMSREYYQCAMINGNSNIIVYRDGSPYREYSLDNNGINVSADGVVQARRLYRYRTIKGIAYSEIIWFYTDTLISVSRHCDDKGYIKEQSFSFNRVNDTYIADTNANIRWRIHAPFFNYDF
ncbi:hypothetical protein F-S17_0011 [Faustovirus]|nr:hypothetical protein F-S17_0011 [Faustovirus]